MPYLLVFGGRGHKSLLRKDFFFFPPLVFIYHSGHATPCWGKLAAICHLFKDCVKIGTLNRELQEHQLKPDCSKRIRFGSFVEVECGKWRWREVQGGWRGGRKGLQTTGEGALAGWGGCCHGFKDMGMFGRRDAPPAPLPLFMCHSLSSSV